MTLEQNPVQYRDAMEALKTSFSKLTGGPRILLVDDSENDRFITRRELDKFICTVVECPSVEEAIRLLDSEKFDLVMCDLKFPRAPATDLISRITQRNLSTEFMALTGNPGSPFADEVTKLGAFRIVPKPISTEFAGRFLTLR